jgi:hypothetical protein
MMLNVPTRRCYLDVLESFVPAHAIGHSKVVISGVKTRSAAC